MVTPPLAVEIEPGIWLDRRRALWLEAERAVVVADLHWGYAASHRAAGNLLPAWGDAQLREGLDQLLHHYAPSEMIWLGDVTHAAAGRAAAEAYLAAAPVRVTVLAGNHDRGWRQAPAVPLLHRAGFTLHHGDRPLPEPPPGRELIGHFHPAAVWSDGAGTRLKFPALVTGPQRWIMPAFSPWAAGVPWNRQRTSGEQLWIITGKRIFRLPE